ncbi:adenosylcobinamide amidohydrolase [Hansschlegelia beijingensis]
MNDLRRANRAFRIVFDRPILAALFDAPQSILSWSLNRPGFQSGNAVVWREVRDADLPLDVNPAALLDKWLVEAGHPGAIGLLTSRDVARHHAADAVCDDVVCSCLVTVGLSNGGRVGQPARTELALVGTINILVHVSKPLAHAALIEAVSIATQARTAAIIDLGFRRDGALVTGTGTDCIVVASPQGAPRERFAGMHTAIGEALGAAVYSATLAGGRAWLRDLAPT